MPIKKIDLFFYLNLFCNDKCNFCFFSKLPPRENFLALESVKKVIHEVGEDKIRGMILTGGEPTLNLHFWEIIEYLYRVYLKTGKIKEFDLSTNAITSADKNIVRKIEQYFSPFKKDKPDIKISFSFSSFKNIKGRRVRVIDKKIRGIKNLMKIDSNLECVITFTKDNYQKILDATRLLIRFLKKRTKKYFFKIDYRLPYTAMIYRLDDLSKLAVPFKDFSSTLNEVLNLAREENISTTLHNIPLCYIKNKPEYFINRKPPKGLAIFPDKKTGFVKRKKLFKFGKDFTCARCKLNKRCDGIEKIYLQKYNYPAFKIFK